MYLKSFSKVSFLLILLLSGSCFFYQSLLFSIRSFWMLQTIEWIQLGLILILSLKRVPTPSVGLILFGYLLSRFLLFQAPPLLEDDFYRYLWDGHLVSEGINPYLFPPSDSFWVNVQSEWRQHINFPDIGTIYPPLAQLYFTLIYKVFGESLLGLRCGAVVIECLLAGLIYKIIRKEKLSLKPLAIFLFFPTLMKENINSVHFDLLAALFTFLFFLKLKETSASLRTTFTTWFSLACAVLTKIFPLLFIPLAFFHSQRKFLGLFIFCGILLLAYVPFLDAGLNIFGGTTAFAKNWLFFESIPFFIQKFYSFFFSLPAFQSTGLPNLLSSDQMTRLTSSFLILLMTLLISRMKNLRLENKFVIILLLLYSLSPVVNTWYWLWVLPFLVIYTPRISWIFPVLTTIGYSWFVDKNIYTQLHQPVYGVFIIALIIFIIKTNYNGLQRWRDN